MYVQWTVSYFSTPINNGGNSRLLDFFFFSLIGKYSHEQKVTTSPCLACLPPALKMSFGYFGKVIYSFSYLLNNISHQAYIRQNILAPNLPFSKANQHPPFFSISLTLFPLCPIFCIPPTWPVSLSQGCLLFPLCFYLVVSAWEATRSGGSAG